MEFNMRVCYGGIFSLNQAGQLRYEEREVHAFDKLDPDLFSRVELLAILKEDVGLKGVKEMWYLAPGMRIDKGLFKISNDSDAVKMTTLVKHRGWVSVYVVRDNETSPDDLGYKDSTTVVPGESSSKCTKVASENVRGKAAPEKEAKEGEKDAPVGSVSLVSKKSSKPAHSFGKMNLRSSESQVEQRVLRNRPFKSPVPETTKESNMSTPHIQKQDIRPGDSGPKSPFHSNPKGPVPESDHSLEGLWDNDDVHSVMSPEIDVNFAVSENDSEDTEYSFVETDAEDDELFNEYVDLDVQEGIGEVDAVQEERDVLQIALQNTNQVDSEVDSADFGFACESDEDGRRERVELFNPLTDFRREMNLKVGMVFPSNVVLRKALQQFSIEKGGDYYYLHNGNAKISVYCKKRCDCKVESVRKRCKCKQNGTVRCDFKCTARVVHSDGSFQIKAFNPRHDCGWQNRNTKLTSIWLAERYVENFKEDPEWNIQAFRAEVKRVHGFDITYSQAWKARSRALYTSNGDSAAQYALIHRYAATIFKYNPGSSVFIKIAQEIPPVFERLYICYDACKKGFVRGCRPVVGLDGCHLRGVVTGQILTAVGLDGNNNIFPIAFAIVEAERRDTWDWFLENLMNDIGEARPTFISDRQKGLIEALSDIVPLSRTRVCVRHMHNNFKAQWPGKSLKDAIWAAARAYIKPDFDAALEVVKIADEKAYEYLMRQDPQTWARHAFDDNTKCDILLNNICESFNAMILPARNKPILTQCEWIKRALMTRFVTKRDQVQTWKGNLTPHATKLIEQARVEGTRSCTVTWGGGDTREVDHYGRTYLVDIPKQCCSCNKWNLTGIPCAHAMAVILRERLDVEQFVSKYYSKEKYLSAYAEVINGMPGMEQYEPSDQQPPLPPKYVMQPGRPKKNARRREEGEEIPSAVNKRVRLGPVKCSNCRQPGHRANKCTNAKHVPDPTLPKNKGGRPRKPESAVTEPRKRRVAKKKAVVAQVGAENQVAGSQTVPLQNEGSQPMCSQVTI